ncbi:MAG TPA: hypothetical protein DD734_09810, partial [Firmicutes bacterium]|nr:hypothetical protein [Bacillota bacterium]
EIITKLGLEQGKTPLMVEGGTEMSSIIKTTKKLAKPGDVVLLSPACASFDLFANYKERGVLFKKQVLAAKEEDVI